MEITTDNRRFFGKTHTKFGTFHNFFNTYVQFQGPLQNDKLKIHDSSELVATKTTSEMAKTELGWGIVCSLAHSITSPIQLGTGKKTAPISMYLETTACHSKLEHFTA